MKQEIHTAARIIRLMQESFGEKAKDSNVSLELSPNGGEDFFLISVPTDSGIESYELEDFVSEVEQILEDVDIYPSRVEFNFDEQAINDCEKLVAKIFLPKE